MAQWVHKSFVDTISKFPLTTQYGSFLRSSFKSNAPETKFISFTKLPRYNYKVVHLNKYTLLLSPLISNANPLNFNWTQYFYNHLICSTSVNAVFTFFLNIQNLWKDRSLSPWRSWQSHYALNLYWDNFWDQPWIQPLQILQAFNHWFRSLRTIV